MDEQTPDKYQQIEQLLLELRAGEASAEDADLLNLLLLGDVELRRHIVRQLLDDAVLREELQISEVVTLFGDQAILPTASNAASDPATGGQGGSALPFLLGFLVAGVAAVVVVAAVATRWKSFDSEHLERSTNRVADSLDQESQFARLTPISAVVWQDGPPVLETGEPLEHRWVRISSGILQIDFSSGALLSLEGPAELRLDSGTECFLKRGKLVALAPLDDLTFTVRTPGSKIVDQGTEFGVFVDQQGKTDVHVLDGEVRLTVAGHQSGHKRLSVKQAARVNSDHEVLPLAFDPETFSPLRPDPLWRRRTLRIQFDCGSRAGLYSGVESPAHSAGYLLKYESFWNTVVGDQKGQFVAADGSMAPCELEIDYGRFEEDSETPHRIDWSAEPDKRRSRIIESIGIFDTALGKDDINAEKLVALRIRGLPPGVYRVYFIGRETRVHRDWGSYLEKKAFIAAIGINLDEMPERPLQIAPLSDTKATKWVEGQTHAVGEITVSSRDDYLTLVTAKDEERSPEPRGGRSAISSIQIIQMHNPAASPVATPEAVE